MSEFHIPGPVPEHNGIVSGAGGIQGDVLEAEFLFPGQTDHRAAAWPENDTVRIAGSGGDGDAVRVSAEHIDVNGGCIQAAGQFQRDLPVHAATVEQRHEIVDGGEIVVTSRGAFSDGIGAVHGGASVGIDAQGVVMPYGVCGVVGHAHPDGEGVKGAASLGVAAQGEGVGEIAGKIARVCFGALQHVVDLPVYSGGGQVFESPVFQAYPDVLCAGISAY